jgi:hypothetical protein
LQKDSEFIVKNTYPSLIEMMGGKDQYIQLFNSIIGMEDGGEEAYDVGASDVEREKRAVEITEIRLCPTYKLR